MIERKEFKRRRRQLMRMADDDAIVIVPAAPERIRNNDSHYPYRQDSDFHYLTGFAEPEAVLVLIPGRSAGAEILFCRERDAKREQWDGPRVGPEGAVEDYALDDAFPIEDIDEILPGMIEGRGRIHYHLGRDTEFDLRIMAWVNRARSEVKQGGRAPHEFVALSHLLHDLRLFKSPAELALMRRSADIAAEAHVRAMQATRPGLHEYAVEAELLHTFRRHGAVASYEPIVGGGNNACVLHYRANNALLNDGDLLLIDAGAEFEGYASDISRTFPVNGRFTSEQRAIHDIVLAAQDAAIEQVRPGRPFNAYHDAAVRVISQGLIDVGLLQGGVDEVVESGAFRKFYMHKTGHWLGLDVHDVGDYRIGDDFRELEAGMVLTVEPGIYIGQHLDDVPAAWRGIGVRIEDDVVVTKSAPEVITSAVPREAGAIEALMAEARHAR